MSWDRPKLGPGVLAAEAERLAARGLTPEQARADLRRIFGHASGTLQERYREAAGWLSVGTSTVVNAFHGHQTFGDVLVRAMYGDAPGNQLDPSFRDEPSNWGPFALTAEEREAAAVHPFADAPAAAVPVPDADTPEDQPRDAPAVPAGYPWWPPSAAPATAALADGPAGPEFPEPARAVSPEPRSRARSAAEEAAAPSPAAESAGDAPAPACETPAAKATPDTPPPGLSPQISPAVLPPRGPEGILSKIAPVPQSSPLAPAITAIDDLICARQIEMNDLVTARGVLIRIATKEAA